jgi:hypothetical protein
VIVFAVATVSASVDSAMNSGMASRGAAPPSPLIVVVISVGCCGAGGWDAGC